MATYTRTYTEGEGWYGAYPATWTYTIVGTDNYAVSDSTFEYPYPTFKAKYVKNASDQRNSGYVRLYNFVTSVVVDNDTSYWLTEARYFYGNGTWKDFMDIPTNGKSMASGTVYTIPLYTADASKTKRHTINTADVFSSDNPTVRTIDVVGYSGYFPSVTSESASSTYYNSYYGDGSCVFSGFKGYKIGSITLDVPPTATVGALSGTTASGYYAGVTSVYVPITDLTAYYGGNFTDGQGGVTLEIGSQTSTIHADGALVISPLNTVGTFTPKVTVTDSRGQTYVETLDPITVTEYKPTANILDLQRINATGEPEDDPDPEKQSDEGTNAVIACQFNYPTISNNYMQAPIVKIDSASPTNTVNWYTSWTESGGFSGQVSFSSYNPIRPVTLYGKITDTLATDTSYEISVACDTTLTPGNYDYDFKLLPQAFYLLSAPEGGHGLGIGRKVPVDAEGRGLHVGMDTIFYENVISQKMAGIIQMYGAPVTQTVDNGIATIIGAPAGWLLCDGSVLNMSAYPILGALLLDTYGGDGINTFALPDFRGRSPLGVGNGTATGHTNHTLGQKAGNENAIVVSHSHKIGADDGSRQFVTRTNNSAGIGESRAASGTAFYAPSINSADNWWGTENTQSATGGASGTGANMPPYIGINFIIATGKLE